MTIAEKLVEKSEPIPLTGCWIWLACICKDGYGQIRVMGKTDRAHRVSYRAFIGEIPDNLFVCHSCDQPLCVNPSHLFLGTHIENMNDMRSKHRAPKGGLLNNTRLNDELAMRIFIADGSPEKIAEEFAVSSATVWRIKAKRNWKHIHH